MTSSVARPCDASLQLVTRSILDRVEGFPQKSYARRLAFRSLITRLMRPASPRTAVTRAPNTPTDQPYRRGRFLGIAGKKRG